MCRRSSLWQASPTCWGVSTLRLRLAADSVSAIGRTVDSASIAAGFEEGERLHRSFRTRRYVAAAVAVTLVAGVVIWLSRGSLGTLVSVVRMRL